MPTALSKEQRNLLARVTLEAREVAETAARAALENLAVHEKDYRGHMTVGQRLLRNRLRARGRALGDRRDERTGTQAIDHLAESAAYEHWHRLLFTRFLAESHLLHTDESLGSVPVTLEECGELAPELGARDGFELACRFASRILPGVFRSDDPVLELRLAPNHDVQLRRLLDELPPELFRADDALGWTYQFWQAKRKDVINQSGVKIGADELPAVTQLFTEDYMVEFLLHNSIGAWWAAKRGPVRAEMEEHARAAVALPERDGLPAITWGYLRFIQDDDGTWRPAAGTFDGWPRRAAEIRFLDPCMGSGHFLVFTLPILARLRMEEEGLGAAEAIAAVLRDNLHGLEIDDRCTQIAAFNVALIAWRLGGYQPLPPLHLACCGLAPYTAERAWTELAGKDDVLRRGMRRLYGLFRDAPLLGSLIDPRRGTGDLLEAGFDHLRPLLAQVLAAEENRTEEVRELSIVAAGQAKAAQLLLGSYELVATNVPFLGREKQDTALRHFIDTYYRSGRADLACVMLERCNELLAPAGVVAAVSPQYWLFLGRYKAFRRWVLQSSKIHMLGKLGTGAFGTIGGEVVNTVLTLIGKPLLDERSSFFAIDAAASTGPSRKGRSLMHGALAALSQRDQLSNPDAVIGYLADRTKRLLSDYSYCYQGLATSDNSQFVFQFWEVDALDRGWEPFQMAPDNSGKAISGCSWSILWEKGAGKYARHAAALKDAGRLGGWRSGHEAWGNRGVAVNRMSELPVALYEGAIFDCNVAIVIPHKPDDLSWIWSFLRSDRYRKEVRRLTQKASVTNLTLIKVPVDKTDEVAAASPEQIQPVRSSDDPTQWLFNGHPMGSEQPLQVAVARLLGYRWPRQTGSEFPDCPALGPDELEGYADADGIVCLPPIHKEQPGAARLRNLLAAAFGADWSPSRERELLAATGARQTSLEDWLRDAFFEQHCKLFHQRPFIWHIWDGRKDGFHALVNYHRLDHATLQKLTYSYLGDWIRQQDADARADKPGAAERLGSARALEAELVKILEGEPPYDLFIRWKPLAEQPLGWQPDLNDGVRLNIRPFLQARDVGKKGAGILRSKPNIKWDKDRGKEPHRDRADYPWFWHDAEPPLDCPGGKTFTGNRWNDVHLTLGRKRAARSP